MKFDAILFDCDGVLVDSEPITMGVLRDMLDEAGWAMPLDECMAFFVGKAVRDERAIIEARTGQPLTDAWTTPSDALPVPPGPIDSRWRCN